MSSLEHALAGAAGGAMSIGLTYPLLSVTTHMQKKHDDEEDKTNVFEKQGTKKPTAKVVFLKLYKEGRLYKGLESCLFGATLSNFIYYFFYEYCTEFFLNRKAKLFAKKKFLKNRLNTVESMVCSLVAGTITATLTNPVWVANTKMTTSLSTEKKTTIRAIHEIARDEGFLHFFKGLRPALVLVINPIIQYTVFEQLKNGVCSSTDTITPGMGFLLGAVSKLVATTLTYPYITVKTRMHLIKQDSDDASDKQGKSETNMRSILWNIIKKEGLWNGLYRGISTKLVQSVLTAAFLFYFKEGILQGIIKLVQMKKHAKLRNKVKV